MTLLEVVLGPLHDQPLQDTLDRSHHAHTGGQSSLGDSCRHQSPGHRSPWGHTCTRGHSQAPHAQGGRL